MEDLGKLFTEFTKVLMGSASRLVFLTSRRQSLFLHPAVIIPMHQIIILISTAPCVNYITDL